MSAIHLVLVVEVAPENHKNWRTLMEEMVSATKNESETMIYEWYYGASGRTCHIHERYVDSAACDVHVANFIANFGSRFLELAGSVVVTVYGDPSERVRETIAGLDPFYFKLEAGFSR